MLNSRVKKNAKIQRSLDHRRDGRRQCLSSSRASEPHACGLVYMSILPSARVASALCGKLIYLVLQDHRDPGDDYFPLCYFGSPCRLL